MNLSNVFSEKFLEAFSSSMIHSLWQGAVLLVVSLLFLFIIDSKSAKLRSAIAYLSMVAVLAAFVITFHLSYSGSSIQVNEHEQTNSLEVISTQNSLGLLAPADNDQRTIEPVKLICKEITTFCTDHSSLIFFVYILGVFLLSLKTIGGYLFTQKIKKKDNQPVSEYFKKRISLIAEEMKVERKIKAFISPNVSQPIVIGYIKPAILLPAAMIFSMPYNQIEAILAHEIAHIKRADYLLNLFQSAIEIIFFFNPAIWVLSIIVRQEREFACDDIALKYYGNNNALASALLSIEQSKEAIPLLSLGILKNKNSLMGRIKRMKHQNKTYLNQQRKISGIIFLLTAVSIALLALQPLKNYSTAIEGSKPKAVNQASLFETFMPRESNTSAVEEDHENEIHDTSKSHKHKSIAEHNHNVSVDVDLSGLDDFHYEFDSEEFEKNMANLGEELSKLENMKFDFNFDFNFDELSKSLPLSPEDSIEFHDEMKKMKKELASLKEMKIELDWDKDEFKETMKELKEEMKMHKKEMANLKVTTKGVKKEMKTLGGFLKEAKEEMVRDGFIEDGDENFELELSKEKMKVNGKTIDAWNHAKYLNIYKNHYGKELEDEININKH